MRLVGLFVAATITALAVAGVGDAAPALAKTSVLCFANEDPCPEEEIYFHSEGISPGEIIGAGGVEVVLPEFSISCAGGKFRMILSETEGPMVGEVTAWKPTKCGPGSCNFEALETGYSAELEATGGGEGKLTVVASTLFANCISPFCLYSSMPIEFTFEGGLPAHMATEAAMGLEGGFGNCGNPATLKARYVIVFPGAPPLYVSHR